MNQHLIIVLQNVIRLIINIDIRELGVKNQEMKVLWRIYQKNVSVNPKIIPYLQIVQMNIVNKGSN